MIQSKDDDDGCDLGLGRGLKPGGIEKDDSSEEELNNPRPNPTVVRVNKLAFQRQLSLISSGKQGRLMSNSSDIDNNSPCSPGPISPPGKIRTFSDMLKMFKKAPSRCLTEVPIAVYAEVPLGSSIKQQRLLYEQDLETILLQHGSNEAINVKASVDKQNENGKVNRDLNDTLKKTQEEVDLLKQDLELCQKQLEAKYQAIRILQSQAYAVQNKQVSANTKAKLLNRKLQKEINELQFAINHQEGNYTSSQSLWAERFDRACQENAALTAALEAKTAEMKKLHAEKMAVVRERDELLVLVDLQERERFEGLRSPSCQEDQAYNDFSSTELAVLGACHCRVQYPEPCACAHTAVFLKRDLARVKLQKEAVTQEKEEALITADAYRIAFEEQLSRNRALLKKLADLTVQPPLKNRSNNNHNDKSRQKTAKELFKWLIDQLNEEASVPKTQHGDILRSGKRPSLSDMENTGSQHTDVSAHSSQNACDDENTADGELSCCTSELSLSSLNDKTQNELIDLLVDMISERSEALAHQRLAARMLACKNQELEAKLTAFETGDEVFLPKDQT